jgi:hypothetical protein
LASVKRWKHSGSVPISLQEIGSLFQVTLHGTPDEFADRPVLNAGQASQRVHLWIWKENLKLLHGSMHRMDRCTSQGGSQPVTTQEIIRATDANSETVDAELAFGSTEADAAPIADLIA